MAAASSTDAVNDFAAPLGRLLTPTLERLATRLSAAAPRLDEREREVVVAAARESLLAALHGKLCRVLLVELNAARVAGSLRGDTPEARWTDFLQQASDAEFWRGLATSYPALPQRLERLLRNRCGAILQVAQRWMGARTAVASLLGRAPGKLLELQFGLGDSHRAGSTVALLRCEGGRLVYKPRPVEIDDVLRNFVLLVQDAHGAELPIGVPRVVMGEDHGWAEFVSHEYASNEVELRNFYRGIGHWLSLTRLLGATDLHAENLIAHRGRPVVVDCETLFTPKIPPRPTGLGAALDYASQLVSGTVLSVGLLPGRGVGLGWRGVDISGVGGLSNEQPMIGLPGILKAGTDEARLGIVEVPASVAKNHPAPKPALAKYWPDVFCGFDELNATLKRLDEQSRLRESLNAFKSCRVRVVPRSTESYAELMRMLWHPVSLHNEAPARAKARQLLAEMATNVSSAPDELEIIEAEIDDLTVGDIPYVSTLAGDGVLVGPRDLSWREPCDLVDAALRDWREADFEREREFINTALVSAYVDEVVLEDAVSLLPKQPRDGELDERRRRQAAAIMKQMIATAIRGQDGTVSWIAPMMTVNGSVVQPVRPDLAGGVSGIALVTAAYVREMRAGRADRVEAVEELLERVVHTLSLAEEKLRKNEKKGALARPQQPGAYVGLGSQIWTRLILGKWGVDEGRALERACELATYVPRSAAADEMSDLMGGAAGALPALQLLAKETGDERYLAFACEAARGICKKAELSGGRAFWRYKVWPDGLGGFAHGATGIGWALKKLARTIGDVEFDKMAEAAFAFEDSLFDVGERNWRDLRNFGRPTAGAWCHGSVGIGLARLDLDRHLSREQTRINLNDAAAATMRLGVGWSHCICHGDLGAFELLERAIAAGEGPDGLTRDDLIALVLTSIEDHGPVSGVLRNAFVPGMLTGLGGIAYQLLRMNPDANLPSVLLLEGGDN